MNPSQSIKAPPLSVVMASAYSIRDTERCLHALIQQDPGKEVEIIVVDRCREDSIDGVMAKYPHVIFIRFPENTSLPILWGSGIARSTGRIIAVTDSTSIPDESWISAILKAHQSPHPVIGGAVEIEPCERWTDWAAYFCEYGQFMRPRVEGVVEELPGNNVSFKRWVLKRGREYVENGFWKTYWCRKLRQEGIPLVSVPSIVVRYNKRYRLLPFIIGRFHHGRCFAGMRIAQASILVRFNYVAGSPGLPMLFLMRIIRTVASKRRYIKKFVLVFPITFLAIVSWSVGEFWGYLASPGESCSKIY